MLFRIVVIDASDSVASHTEWLSESEAWDLWNELTSGRCPNDVYVMYSKESEDDGPSVVKIIPSK